MSRCEVVAMLLNIDFVIGCLSVECKKIVETELHARLHHVQGVM